VAEQKSKLQQAGLTRGKMLIIGILAVVLVGVIYLQYGPSGISQQIEPATPATESRIARPALEQVSPAVADAGESEVGLAAELAVFDHARWETPELSEVIAYDPFAVPAAFPQSLRAVLDPTLAAQGGDSAAAAFNAKLLAEAVEQMQLQLEELQQRGVHVIVNLRDQYVAMIGDRTVHVGDEINGFVVTAIDPDGVRVERKSIQ
jgi:hypothetical protein